MFKKIATSIFVVLFVLLNIEVGLFNEGNLKIGNYELGVSYPLLMAFQSEEGREVDEADCSDMNNSDCNQDSNTKCNTSGTLYDETCFLKCSDGVVIWCHDPDDPEEN